MQIPFGLNSSGRLLAISEVERGAACNCSCPGCGAPLLARKGEVNTPHFAHASGADCNTGVETSLHLAAKQLIADRGRLRLPALVVSVSRTAPEVGLFTASKTFRFPEEWRFDRVELEPWIDGIRPDALGYEGNTRYAVEIRVTHAVGPEKEAQLAALAVPCIEVDLSALVGKMVTFEDLEREVIESTGNKKWLFHPSKEEWEAELLAGFEDWRVQRLKEFEEELAEIEEHETVQASESRQLRAPSPARVDPYRASNEAYQALPLHEKWSRLERKLGVARADFPRHLSVTLREGADAVLAEKELWQGALFATYVLGTDGEKKVGKRISEANVCKWLAQRFGVKGQAAETARPAVRAYLGYLRACGFLEKRGFDLLVAHDRLTPPLRTQPAKPIP